MQVEQITPKAAGSSSEIGNFWLTCAWCNSYKGTKTSARDPVTGTDVALFNPRNRLWADQFTWDGESVRIIGVTPTGRATVAALQLNNPIIVPARRRRVIAGRHPPGTLGSSWDRLAGRRALRDGRVMCILWPISTHGSKEQHAHEHCDR
ncbi:MAG: hypothetical protein WAM94_12560 [Chromatiaceae bacterium]